VKTVRSLKSWLCLAIIFLAGCGDRKDVLYDKAWHGDQLALAEYIKRGYDPNAALWLAIKKNSAAFVEMLLTNGADPNVAGGYSMTPLMIASTSAKPEIVRLLIQHGAKVDIRDERGDNAVAYAVRGDAENIVLLVSTGANINNVNKNGDTPLSEAVAYQESSGLGQAAITILLSLGANANSTNHDGMTPITLAQRGNDSKIVALLKSRLSH